MEVNASEDKKSTGTTVVRPRLVSDLNPAADPFEMKFPCVFEKKEQKEEPKVPPPSSFLFDLYLLCNFKEREYKSKNNNDDNDNNNNNNDDNEKPGDDDDEWKVWKSSCDWLEKVLDNEEDDGDKEKEKVLGEVAE